MADYTQQALAMGALGYALKPVRRDQLVEALQRLEATFSQSRRYVLIVEDDALQRDGIAALLANGEAQITAVQNAAAAREQLRTGTFDCMVMDLNHPAVTNAKGLQGRINAIAIGASAGGVQALSVLLPALPAALRASLFIVLHLPRERPSPADPDLCAQVRSVGKRGGR